MTSIDRETEKLRLWLEGQSIADISRRTGIGRTTLYRFMKVDGYKPTLTVLSRLASLREKKRDLTVLSRLASAQEREKDQDNGDKAA
ncbi:MAG: helix-turn-helix domain-containing protein [Geminicoccaceae bacterium]